MLKLIRCLFLTVMMWVVTISLYAQEEIYTLEVGVHGGVSYFFGDVKAKPFDFQADYGVLFRYLFNQRMSLQADFNHNSIQGDYEQKIEAPNVTINQNINALDFTFAFNFFDYIQLDYVLKSSDHTAYLFAGAGLIHLNNRNSNKLNISIPLGVGYKFLLYERLHLNVQWTHRLMLADNIEGYPELNNSLGMNGSNILNNDHLGTVTVGVSYGLFRRKCKCFNYK